MTTGDVPGFGPDESTPDPLELFKQDFRNGLGELSEEADARIRAHIEAEIAKDPENREAASQSPKAEEILDELFTHIILGDPESKFQNLPDHLAVNYLEFIDEGVECFQILNWETKDRFTIVRPSISSPNVDELRTSITGDSNVIYQINRTNLFNLPYPLETITKDAEEGLGVEEIAYEISAGRILSWGDTPLGEIIVLDEVSHGTREYKELLDSLLDDTYIDKLADGLFD